MKIFETRESQPLQEKNRLIFQGHRNNWSSHKSDIVLYPCDGSEFGFKTEQTSADGQGQCFCQK